MNNLYKVIGNTVYLNKFKVTYDENRIKRSINTPIFMNEIVEIPLDIKPQKIELPQSLITVYVTKDERDEIKNTIIDDGYYEEEVINQFNNDWLDKKEFKDQSLINKAFELGEKAYKQYLIANDENLQLANYLIDLDYRLSLLEDE